MTHWKRSPRAGLGLLALALALVLVAPGSNVSLAAGTIIYVDADATGTHDGTSWATAFTNLQDGLTAAVTTPAEIWVAEGTYKPTVEYDGTGDRYRSFQLKNGVALYGGFDPSVGHDTFPERDWVAHPTILSGDLGTSSNNSDNSYHVFYHPSGTNLDSSAILDGFIITGGNANGSYGHESSGGGMYNTGSPALTRCTFLGNSATNGGGMYNTGSPVLTSCIFAGNTAGESGDGGGMANIGVVPHLIRPHLINCTFTGNSARDGGGMYNAGAAPQLFGCTFSRNSALGFATGGMTNYGSPSTTLTNCILWGNKNSQILSSPEQAAVRNSDIQGGYLYPGGSNINVDPLFVDPDGADNVVGTADDDLRLGAGSPVVNAGSNSLLPADTVDLDRDGNTTESNPLDLDGYPRVVNYRVDMGAYEYHEPLPVLDVSASSNGDLVYLTFAHAGEDATYEVWRGSYPDFVVVSEGTNLGNVCKIYGTTDTVMCTLVDAITNPPVTSFYVVRASFADQGGAFSDSARTGVIGFILASGD